MHAYRTAVLAAVGVVAVALGALAASAQVPGTVQEFGRPVVPMFEGWYFNQDGTATILVGFFNPNQTQTVDLPVGELNQFSPGPADRGQPTHFPPGRSWGVLTIQVPGDFDGDLTWTLTANDQPASIPVHLRHRISSSRSRTPRTATSRRRSASLGEARRSPDRRSPSLTR